MSNNLGREGSLQFYDPTRVGIHPWVPYFKFDTMSLKNYMLHVD